MGKRKRIIIVGLPYFAKKLCRDLQLADPTNSYKHLDTYFSKWDKLKALFLIPRAHLLYSINGSVTKSKTFDLAIQSKVPIIMHWVGTDVLLAKEAVEKTEQLNAYIQYATHFAEVSWIKTELNEIGIQAKIVNFASFDQKYTVHFPKTDSLNVLNYIADSKPLFYGIEKYLQLAKHFPEIQFYIAGTKASQYEPLPKNVIALGWVEDMNQLQEKMHLCVRTTEHDGLSTFVLEALARGKYVFYSNPFHYCVYVPTIEDMIRELTVLKDTFQKGQLEPNVEGKNYVENEFNRTHIFKILVNEIQKSAKS